MRSIVCDICTRTVDKYDPDCILSTKPNKEVGLFGALSSTCSDICGDCVRLGRTLDFKANMIEFWRKKCKQ